MSCARLKKQQLALHKGSKFNSMQCKATELWNLLAMAGKKGNNKGGLGGDMALNKGKTKLL